MKLKPKPYLPEDVYILSDEETTLKKSILIVLIKSWFSEKI